MMLEKKNSFHKRSSVYGYQGHYL